MNFFFLIENFLLGFCKFKPDALCFLFQSTVFNNQLFAASWSEMGRVNIWNLEKQMQAVNDMTTLAKYQKDGETLKTKPVFTFSGHQSEGFAVDWCPTIEGMLATGDCKKNIHLWNPEPSGWKVDQKPLLGHEASVEDVQWSPNERHVLCSASVDKRYLIYVFLDCFSKDNFLLFFLILFFSIRIWDTRASGNKANMITVENAHDSDVNVINWNRNEPFIVSGGDDGFIHVWDLRELQVCLITIKN